MVMQHEKLCFGIFNDLSQDELDKRRVVKASRVVESSWSSTIRCLPGKPPGFLEKVDSDNVIWRRERPTVLLPLR